ncbi:MAG TPA: hypothetical protein VIK55_12530 [Paludibacter sp.]
MNNKRQSLFSDDVIKQQDVMSNLKKAFGLFGELDASFSDIQYMKLNKELIDIEQIYPLIDNEKEELNRMLKYLETNPDKKPTDLTDSEKALYDKKTLRDFFKQNIDNIAKLETSREYYPVEEFFEKQCEKERLLDPTFSTKVFALSEKLRIEGILEQVTQLSDKSYYSNADTFKQALKYIDYLNTVIENEGKVKAPENICVPKINEDIIDDILKDMFRSIKPIELTNLKLRLYGNREFIENFLPLDFIGTLNELYVHTAKLKEIGIKRQDRLFVFTTHVRYKENVYSESTKRTEKQLKHKI